MCFGAQLQVFLVSSDAGRCLDKDRMSYVTFIPLYTGVIFNYVEGEKKTNWAS